MKFRGRGCDRGFDANRKKCEARKEEGARGNLAVRSSKNDGADASTYYVVVAHACGE